MLGVRPWRGVTSLTERCRTARHRAIRLCTGGQDLSVEAQLATGTIIFALSAWVTITSVSYFGSRQLLSDSFQQISHLKQAYADLLAEFADLDHELRRADRRCSRPPPRSSAPRFAT